jgi:hypothetical protein
MSQATQLSLTATSPDVDNLRVALDTAMAERDRLRTAWLRARDTVYRLRYAYRLAKDRERRRQKKDTT